MHKFAIGLVAAMILVAACGSSSKSTSTGSGGATTTSGKSSGGGSATTAGGGSSGGGNSSLSSANIEVTYKETGGTDPSSDSTLTFAQNGKGKTFFTSQDSTDTSTPPTTIYYDGTTVVECEGTGSTATCTQIPAAEAAIATSLTTAFSALAAVASTVGGGDKSSDTIAGRDASCTKYNAQTLLAKIASNPIFKNSDVKASDYDANDTLSICLDKRTGFPLRFGGTKKGAPDDQLEATAVSEPNDSDFTPPVTPKTVPDITLPGGSTLPDGVTIPGSGG